MQKKYATHVSDDYSFELVEIFKNLIMENLESEIVMSDIVERYIDSSKYDTARLISDMSNFDTIDILEELLVEFETKFANRIGDRLKERIGELDIEDYME